MKVEESLSRKVHVWIYVGFTPFPGLLVSLISQPPCWLFMYCVACLPGSNVKPSPDLPSPQSLTRSSSLHVPQASELLSA